MSTKAKTGPGSFANQRRAAFLETLRDLQLNQPPSPNDVLFMLAQIGQARRGVEEAMLKKLDAPVPGSKADQIVKAWMEKTPPDPKVIAAKFDVTENFVIAVTNTWRERGMELALTPRQQARRAGKQSALSVVQSGTKVEGEIESPVLFARGPAGATVAPPVVATPKVAGKDEPVKAIVETAAITDPKKTLIAQIAASARSSKAGDMLSLVAAAKDGIKGSEIAELCEITNETVRRQMAEFEGWGYVEHIGRKFYPTKKLTDPQDTEKEPMRRFTNSNELIKLCEQQGWRTENTSRGTLCYPPDKSQPPVPVYPNNTNYHDVRNILSWLRRSGFDPDWQPPKAEAKPEPEPPKNTPAPAPESPAKEKPMSLIVKSRYVTENAKCELSPEQIKNAIYDYINKQTGQRPPNEARLRFHVERASFELAAGNKVEISWEIKRELREGE